MKKVLAVALLQLLEGQHKTILVASEKCRTLKQEFAAIVQEHYPGFLVRDYGGDDLIFKNDVKILFYSLEEEIKLEKICGYRFNSIIYDGSRDDVSNQVLMEVFVPYSYTTPEPQLYKKFWEIVPEWAGHLLEKFSLRKNQLIFVEDELYDIMPYGVN